METRQMEIIGLIVAYIYSIFPVSIAYDCVVFNEGTLNLL